MSNDKTTVKGVWWLETQPAKKLLGEVVFGSTSGADVDVYGHFHDTFDDTHLLQRFTLHGETIKTKPIYSFETFFTGGEMNLPGGMSCRLHSCLGVVGGHYSSLKQIAFKNVHVRIQGLVDWTWITGLQIKFDEKPQGFVANYKVPSVIPVGKYGAFSVELRPMANLQPIPYKFDFKEDCILVIEADQMQPYFEFEEHILTFQRFLSLAMQHPVQVTQIIGHVDKPAKVVKDIPVFEDFLIIREVIVKPWTRDSSAPHGLLFSLPELGESPEKVFGAYVERQKLLLPAIDLYLSTVYNDGQIPRVDFLTLAHRDHLQPQSTRYSNPSRLGLNCKPYRNPPCFLPRFRVMSFASSCER